MLLYVVKLTIGMLLLFWGAERFIVGSIAIAKHFAIAKFVIGVTIVALGTSAPEIFVSLIAATEQKPLLAIGNVLGSNIANLGLVLGLSGLLVPLHYNFQQIKPACFLMLIISIVVGIIFTQQVYLPLIAWGLILLFCIIMFLAPKNNISVPSISENTTINLPRAIFWTIFGIILLPISSQLTVDAASNIAVHLGISELVIGLSIVAIGTSLPELVTSLIGIYKREHELALGNIIGSNIINLTLVLGITGIFHPIVIPQIILQRDLPFLISISLATSIILYCNRQQQMLGRVWSASLMFIFISYFIILF